jgi:hypothetical protein
VTYIDGLKAAEAACHKVRERSLKDRREAKGEGDSQSRAYATAEALTAWMCIEEIQALIEKAPS